MTKFTICSTITMPAKKDPSKTDNFIVEELTKLINQKHDELTKRIDNRLREITEFSMLKKWRT